MAVPDVPPPGPTITVPGPPATGRVAAWTFRVTAPPLSAKRMTLPVAQLAVTWVQVFAASVSLEFVVTPAVVNTTRRLADPCAFAPLTPSDHPPCDGSPKRTKVCCTRAEGLTQSSTPVAVPGTVSVMVPAVEKRAARLGGALKAPAMPDVTPPWNTPLCPPLPRSVARAPDVSSSGQ